MRNDRFNMHLREHSNPCKRQYTAIRKPGTEESSKLVVISEKQAAPQKLRRTDMKYHEPHSSSYDFGTDESSEAEEWHAEDGETDSNKQEGDVDDQILRFHQGVDNLLKVLVTSLQKANDSLKNQVELQNSEYGNQLAVLKKQNETLTTQVQMKTIECGDVEHFAEQLKSEVELWKSKFVDGAVKLFKQIEANGKENKALRMEKDSFKEENDSLKSQVEKLNTEFAKAGQIATQLNESESVKVAGLETQNKSLKDQLAKWKTNCGRAEQARKELQSQLIAFWTKLGIATPPTAERVTIRSPKNEDVGH